MTVTIIITLSILVLIAYIFDITTSKTKIPSVILLLLLGFTVKLITSNFNLNIPDLNLILPILGTVGLILIVLEGSLELDINKTKLPLILKSSIIAFLPLLITSLGVAYFVHIYFNIPLKIALTNCIPIAIISSAISIPSAINLPKNQKEFITYESSLSDIFGVIMFNFISLNDNIGTQSITIFSLELILMLVISFVATLLLAGFLNKVKHHIKFIPMILMVLMVYSVSKIFHLPALLFILIFGLFMGNIDELRNYKFIQQFHPINFSKEVIKFKEITAEIAFLIRALFFMLFGFLIEINDVLNTNTILLSLSITVFIYLVRFITIKTFSLNADPLVYIAPRGLITILLFLSIPSEQQIFIINKSLIIQVIILTALIMMIGMIIYKKSENDT
jgi:cell volume regulation protein A